MLPRHHRRRFQHPSRQPGRPQGDAPRVLSSSDLVQPVSGSTHTFGHTLDLVITGSDLRVESVIVDPAGAISDHGLVRCLILLAPLNSTSHARLVRSWKIVDREELCTTIEQSSLHRPRARILHVASTPRLTSRDSSLIRSRLFASAPVALRHKLSNPRLLHRSRT